MGAPINWFIGWPVAAETVPAAVWKSLPAGLYRLDGDDLHVTLAFLGPVGEERAASAWSLVSDLPCPLFQARLQRAVALGNPRRPSACGIAVDDADQRLARFIGTHRDPLRAAAGVGVESRPPLPHVTLARPPRSAGPAIRERITEWAAGLELPDAELLLDRLALYTRAPASHRQRFVRIAERSADAASP